MRTVLKTLYALLILVCTANAQNEIDHIATLYPSGYGKMAIDGDTLYVNILNGHGVERYDIADPANPTFIDREEVSGFDQIDFNRRLMAKIESTGAFLIDFSNFAETRIVSHLSPVLPFMLISSWKLKGDHMLAISNDDTIRTFDISNPADPTITSSIGLLYRTFDYSILSIIGSSVCISFRGDNMIHLNLYQDVYDIRDPNNIHFSYSDTIRLGSWDFYSLQAASGDTEVVIYGNILYGIGNLFLYLFSSDSMIALESFGNGYRFSGAQNGFIINYLFGFIRAYSYDNFLLLGQVPDPYSIYYEICPSNFPLYVSANNIKVYSPTYSDTLMPEIYSYTIPHHGIFSSTSYGNYVLSGAESNGGELLIHELNDANRLSLISTVPTVKANKIIIEGLSAICLCPDKISQVGLSDPFHPMVLHELDGFSGELLDFALYDSLLFAITNQAYYVIDYDSLSGMTILSQMDFPAGSLTSMGQNQTTSVLLEGNFAELIKINAANPNNPVVEQWWHLPHDTLQNLEILNDAVWVSGHNGTRIVDIVMLDSLAFLGPEYFSDVHQIYISGDTLYAADGINGVRIFTYSGQPYENLRYIGGYSTGNIINQVSTIRDNFFVSDYYSLQQLRWGAPTGIDGPDYPPVPELIALMQNYPNPFNARTTISYTLSRPTNVTIEIYDLLGRKIETLVNRYQSAGEQSVVWDAAGHSSGVYFYRIKAGDHIEIRKCVLLK